MDSSLDSAALKPPKPPQNYSIAQNHTKALPPKTTPTIAQNHQKPPQSFPFL
ncbi:hypothetical protein [Helicobacter sp. CLO-3]|uniref:hypothetical protein n=1 Tax=Helicobacter sp. CLO-3 TaxID=211 RepID=UPI00155F9AB8|nr:hypothetical protein [Helicobacter sp. CLO-3]